MNTLIRLASSDKAVMRFSSGDHLNRTGAIRSEVGAAIRNVLLNGAKNLMPFMYHSEMSPMVRPNVSFPEDCPDVVGLKLAHTIFPLNNAAEELISAVGAPLDAPEKEFISNFLIPSFPIVIGHGYTQGDGTQSISHFLFPNESDSYVTQYGHIDFAAPEVRRIIRNIRDLDARADLAAYSRPFLAELAEKFLPETGNE